MMFVAPRKKENTKLDKCLRVANISAQWHEECKQMILEKHGIDIDEIEKMFD